MIPLLLALLLPAFGTPGEEAPAPMAEDPPPAAPRPEPPPPPLHPPAAGMTPEEVATFAGWLADQGAWDQAAMTWRELAWRARGTPVGSHALWEEAAVWLDAGLPDRARSRFQAAYHQADTPTWRAAFATGEGLARWRIGDFQGARTAFEQSLSVREDPGTRWLLAWSAGAGGDPELATRLAARIEGPLAAPAEAWSAAVASMPVPRRRSPAAAGILSLLIPGAGQAWTGTPGDTLPALLVVGGLGTATFLLARDEHWGLAVPAGFLFLTFHGGNIASAVHSARAWNREQQQAWVEALDGRWPVLVECGVEGHSVRVPDPPLPEPHP